MTALVPPRHAHEHPAYRTGARTMRVCQARALTATVTHFRFEAMNGGPLAPYAAGSHLIVSAGDHRNAYSLVDDGWFPQSYGISVLRRGEGGGSDWLHDHLAVGDLVEIEGPRSMFAPVTDQQHALLVAGGIGVTPILSHARAMRRNGVSAEILYSYRPGCAAHLEDLRALAADPSITLHEVTGAGATEDLLAGLFASQPLGTHAYACGPPGFLDVYTARAAEAGWPSARVHLERFTAPEQDAGEPFTARLTGTGEVIEVPSGVSLLDRLLERGIEVDHMCRRGVCGQCRIPVTSGRVEHRDLVLSEDERRSGDSMLCCVSRGHEIEVDL
ncbi:PDR/VanB family oxidoreductase [Gordonia sp. VNK21]|uniref:PDR/VanB family oxidoreductase n=1 Tax=Gordonia sp. VNK21 TaxID=3382483 RepID=UPI0038D46D63